MGNCKSTPTGEDYSGDRKSRPSKQRSTTSLLRAASSSPNSRIPTNIGSQNGSSGNAPNDYSDIINSKINQQRWTHIYQTNLSRIVDPADFHSVMDECIAETLHKFNAAEMTLLSRRVRKIVRSLLHSNTASNHRTAIANMSVGDINKSKSVYQKENLLDENLVQMIFVSGRQRLQVGAQKGYAGQSLSDHLERMKEKKSQTLWCMVGYKENEKEENDEVPSDEESLENKNSSNKPTAKLTANGKHAKNGSHHKESNSTKSQRSSVGDPIQSAFTILLYLAESRWDYAAAIARTSTKKAGLNLDVNQQANNSSKELSKVTPSPPPQQPTTEYYGDEIPSPPPKPNGISFRDLSYLIGLALRSSRQQRLVVLFHLLLKPSSLEQILKNHPGGGIPTWLMEVESDCILSFASLSHYFYYGGNKNEAKKSKADSSSSAPWELKIDIFTAIETLAVLLHFDGSLLNRENDPPTDDASQISTISGNRNRVLSYGDQKYDSAKVHVMLAEYLYEVRNSNDKIPTFENEAESRVRIELMDSFWDASHELYTKLKEQKKAKKDVDVPSEQKSWSLDEFMKWADVAISDDAALDVIMNQLFGMGLLPTPPMERYIVSQSWKEWQTRESHLFNQGEGYLGDTITVMTQGIQNLLSFSQSGEASENLSLASDTSMATKCTWGGVGGYDGKGGLGYGMMYCIDKGWWDEWMNYVNWEWESGKLSSRKRSRKRPRALSSDALLDHSTQVNVGGTLGSYEKMKSDLKKDVHYVLIPPSVWNILYELYGGGPPLPRMIAKTESWFTDNSPTEITLNENNQIMPYRIPRHLNVLTHPWILSCHVCDPHQPYRRGNIGPLSIRLMTSPNQPLYRLLAEIVFRLPVFHPRGKDKSGKGLGRLWKKIEVDGSLTKSGILRYGPWALLCNRGFASFPVGDTKMEKLDYQNLKQSWDTYAGRETVESAGLSDGMSLMFEYALINKNGKFSWPRETAAKEGKKKREEEEDKVFARTIRGLNKKGELIPNVRSLIGTVVDCLDSNGRWYQAEITDVDTKASKVSEEEEDGYGTEEDEEGDTIETVPGEVKAIRVDFTDVGGHEEWISVKSDRIAVAERFTEDSMRNMDDLDSGTSNGAAPKIRSLVLRKHPSNEVSTFQLNRSICSYPGFGACGLTNLGNSCYINSAVQCMSYMPFLRSYLISGSYKRNLNKDNPLGTGGKVIDEFAELLKVMWSAKHGVKQATRFRGQLGRARQQFSAADQQDAQELLNDLLDILHEDSNQILKKPYVEAPEDHWVTTTPLPRVGREAWRRFLRRNRSIVANTAMGQVLNRVTCPTCNHTSLNFDPFNMLSVPFPPTAQVIFKCRLFRRSTPNNCPQTLALSSKNSVSPSSQSDALIEDFIIPMSRVADVSDLRAQIQKLSGVSSKRLKLCIAEEVAEGTKTKNGDTEPAHLNLRIIPEREPCLELIKKPKKDEVLPSHTLIFAFESTLNPRPTKQKNPPTTKKGKMATIMEEKNTEGKEEKEDSSNGNVSLKEQMQHYGDKLECRLYDTDPLPLSKAVSRGMWPKTVDDFEVGLRVDAIDQKQQWFPGAVVEIIEPDEKKSQSRASSAASQKIRVKVHFDNYASKWDLLFTIEHFERGRVQPLHSHSVPKEKPIEFRLYHRNKSTMKQFGQPFFLLCHNEWNTARAGAHIFAQASRFLEGDTTNAGTEHRNLLSKIIDVLIEADQKRAISSVYAVSGDKIDAEKIVDPMTLSAELGKVLGTLLPQLPFEICICDSTYPKAGSSGEEAPFAFSLLRTIGNYMNARQSLILHWKDNDSATETSGKSLNDSSFHCPPPVVFHSQSHEAFKESEGKKGQNESNTKEGLPLGVCLDEYCKEQNLGLSECWRCPICKDVREGCQSMKLWKLPDLLTFHLKRFNCSATWREKITTKINFPLTGLNVKDWCDTESPAMQGSNDDCLYDLIGVVNHLGGMTSGHYIANCKATSCSTSGSEEIEHGFNGAGVYAFGDKGEAVQSGGGWKLGRITKEKDASNNVQTRAALSAAKYVAESSEPLWLQFDDDLVEPIPPSHVITENAYVLFYRKRRISPSNIARYSTMD